MTDDTPIYRVKGHMRRRSEQDPLRILRLVADLQALCTSPGQLDAILNELENHEPKLSGEEFEARLLERMQGLEREVGAPPFEEHADGRVLPNEVLETEVRAEMSEQLERNESEAADDSVVDVPLGDPAVSTESGHPVDAATPTLVDIRRDVAALRTTMSWLTVKANHGWRFSVQYLKNVGGAAIGSDLEATGEGD